MLLVESGEINPCYGSDYYNKISVSHDNPINVQYQVNQLILA